MTMIFLILLILIGILGFILTQTNIIPNIIDAGIVLFVFISFFISLTVPAFMLFFDDGSDQGSNPSDQNKSGLGSGSVTGSGSESGSGPGSVSKSSPSNSSNLVEVPGSESSTTANPQPFDRSKFYSNVLTYMLNTEKNHSKENEALYRRILFGTKDTKSSQDTSIKIDTPDNSGVVDQTDNSGDGGD